MATTYTTGSSVAGHSIGHHFNSAFARLFGAFAAWNDTRVTRNALSRLSAHELDDLGLSRGDLENIGSKLHRF
jgi:uncharacterized protein YjiS (DUF1127 family)